MFFVHDRGKDGAKGFAKAANAEQDGVDGLRFVEQQRTKAGGTFLRDETRVGKEEEKSLPRKVVGGGRGIGEVEGEASGDEVRGRNELGRHVTGVSFQDGYSRNAANATAGELYGQVNRPWLRARENHKERA